MFFFLHLTFIFVKDMQIEIDSNLYQNKPHLESFYQTFKSVSIRCCHLKGVHFLFSKLRETTDFDTPLLKRTFFNMDVASTFVFTLRFDDERAFRSTIMLPLYHNTALILNFSVSSPYLGLTNWMENDDCLFNSIVSLQVGCWVYFPNHSLKKLTFEKLKEWIHYSIPHAPTLSSMTVFPSHLVDLEFSQLDFKIVSPECFQSLQSLLCLESLCLDEVHNVPKKIFTLCFPRLHTFFIIDSYFSDSPFCGETTIQPEQTTQPEQTMKQEREEPSLSLQSTEPKDCKNNKHDIDSMENKNKNQSKQYLPHLLKKLEITYNTYKYSTQLSIFDLFDNHQFHQHLVSIAIKGICLFSFSFFLYV